MDGDRRSAGRRRRRRNGGWRPSAERMPPIWTMDVLGCTAPIDEPRGRAVRHTGIGRRAQSRSRALDRDAFPLNGRRAPPRQRPPSPGERSSSAGEWVGFDERLTAVGGKTAVARWLPCTRRTEATCPPPHGNRRLVEGRRVGTGRRCWFKLGTQSLDSMTAFLGFMAADLPLRGPATTGPAVLNAELKRASRRGEATGVSRVPRLRENVEPYPHHPQGAADRPEHDG